MPAPSALEIPDWCWDAMSAYVAGLAPQEACGLLAGHSGRVAAMLPVPNALSSPVRFRMAPLEQLQAFERIDDAGMELLAIFHSHPRGPSVPSPTDIAEAFYPVVQVIWCGTGGQWQARGFWIDGDGFDEVILKGV